MKYHIHCSYCGQRIVVDTTMQALCPDPACGYQVSVQLQSSLSGDRPIFTEVHTGLLMTETPANTTIFDKGRRLIAVPHSDGDQYCDECCAIPGGKLCKSTVCSASDRSDGISISLSLLSS